MIAAALAAALGVQTAQAGSFERLKEALRSKEFSFDGTSSEPAPGPVLAPSSGVTAASVARQQACIKQRRREGRLWTGYTRRAPGRQARAKRIRAASAARKLKGQAQDCGASSSDTPSGA